ncbi:cation:proton antiporter domain-containing protein [Mycobacterium sp. IDR2000157661]|uniref:cation:proton antiporter domain-containing protein n=1 Tax=Mycobacterium sp. IDR2000157661 TaxID=2867005 RepID=UPI001EEB7BA4|nr:cation:proton antiporter [Mycobacterium sp. IDR2000157661]ULE33915.1 cation:proton antiporter [Mycobacterium sp. IDR2000157661]
MEVDIVLTAVGILGVVVAALSAKMRRLPISEPLLGLVAGVLIGPQVFDVFRLPPITEAHSLLHEASRILLAVSVMAVALRYPFADVRRCWRPVTLLLLVAMPVMAMVSAALGWLVLSIPLAAAVLLGAAICPTDPVLASSVVTGEDAERDLPAHDRRLLSLESGANDGLALPLVLAAIAVAGGLGAGAALGESLWQVLGAVAVGAGMGSAGGLALKWGDRYGATASAPALFFTLVLALGILGVAGLVHTDGVLAVFVGGLAFNLVGTGRERAAEVPIDEAINRFAVLPLFVILGATLPWATWFELGWRAVVLALAILVLRRIPILLLLRRPLRLQTRDALYLGWFGPVGVSALFYLTLEAERMGVDETVLAAGCLVLVMSTIAFGLSGVLGRSLYVKAAEREAAAADRESAK